MAVEALGSTVEQGVKGQRQVRVWPNPNSLMSDMASAVAAQQQNLLLYAPLFLIAGNWTYFQLGIEPSAPLTVILFALGTGLVGRRQNAVLLIAGLILIGFCVTKFREEQVATPMLRGPVNGVAAAGYIADIENKAKGSKELVIALESATLVPADEMPRRVRLYVANADGLKIGDYISFNAYLSPLPRPVQPDGFDYGRMLFFQSIGAGGRIVGLPVLETRPIPWSLEYRRIFRALRAEISDRITAVIPGAVGHLADSMVSGERSGIPPEMYNSLQISGLAHIISISGLHMSMVAGGVFWAVRALLALVPFFALHLPIKKIAAVAALIVGLVYTLLADSGSATERSYLMIAVMFFAVLVDRPAISLRNLAIAAIIILVITPEESVGASFQMSFLAVMGLAALGQWLHSRESQNSQPEKKGLARLAQKLWRFVMLAALTTLVAGGTSTIAAVYHFDRLSPYSVIANGLTLPVSEALVMPPAIIAVLLMPFGLEYWPLKLMQFGLETMMNVSDWVASLPAANLLVAKPNAAGIVTVAFGAAILAVGVGRFRWVGFALVVLGMLIACLGARPAILIEDRATAVAVLNSDGNYVFSTGSKNKFAGSKWLQGNGETSGLIDAETRPGWDCTAGDCFTDLAPMSLSYLRQSSGQEPYCPPTAIIIADYPLHHACRDARIVIDRIDVWRKGAHAISFSGGQYFLITARDEQGDRPWTYDSRKGIGTKAQLVESAQSQ